ncbi:SAM-dependent methyltransferase [Pseudomonas putida]|uniref:SAM-dependent methyltransferase n=1 Tax=Pseudomonas putida TaxID=303 RepID=A0A7U6REF3_PSEPU|nr:MULTISPECIES: methyltransferase domain-containing protein [Pseudomonas putida group]MDD2125688.1 methyltransferase domain-containing protein [Pseudomonas monteilii]BBU46499.1 SAM-dependent methyltransferase [Pseudomonas putida]
MTSWNAFYERTETRAPSPLLSCAMDHVRGLQPRHAIDLGCGSGNEAWQLIQGGWQVLAIDKEPEAIARTIRKCSMAEARRLTAEVADFEHLAHFPSSALIHAGLALPFCRPNRFPNLWCQIRNALVPGGVFVGHFFGLRHGWGSEELMSFHSVDDIRRLSEGFEIVLLRESELSMVIDSGAVNWHRINVIVRKPHQ